MIRKNFTYPVVIFLLTFIPSSNIVSTKPEIRPIKVANSDSPIILILYFRSRFEPKRVKKRSIIITNISLDKLAS